MPIKTTAAKNSKTGFKGVCYYKHINKWIARIRIAYKSIYLGCFTSPEKAHRAYKKAVREYRSKH